MIRDGILLHSKDTILGYGNGIVVFKFRIPVDNEHGILRGDLLISRKILQVFTFLTMDDG
jgi:hypothetical protein